MASSSPGPRWSGRVPPLVLAALAAGVAVRVALLAVPPLFLTDVSYYNSQAVAHLLGGVDPYGASYSVPPLLATPGAETVLAYLPGVFAFLVPGDFGTGARLGLVACDLVVASALVSFRRPGALLAAAFLLFPPVVVFSTSFLNDSLPAIAFLSAGVALESRGNRTAAAVLVGASLAASQETWFLFPLYAAYCVRRRAYRLPLVSAATGAAIVLPFLAWDPGAFVHDTLLFQFQRTPLPLFSNGPFGLNVNPSLQGLLSAAGVSAPLALRAALAGLVLFLVAWRSGRSFGGLLAGSAVAVTACLFLLSGDFFWSYLELPFALALFWAAGWLGAAEPPSTLKEPDGRVGAASA